MEKETVIWEAEFNPSVKMYWLVSSILVLVITVFGILLLPIWIPAALWFTGIYLKSHRCTLTDRTLKFSKGVLVRQEKTVPLDRITDLGLTQGPIMRAFNIEAISVETAGQSSPGSLIQLSGIRDGRAFRDAVLKQRDSVVGSSAEESQPTSPAVNLDGQANLLREIRDTLQRIETLTRDNAN